MTTMTRTPEEHARRTTALIAAIEIRTAQSLEALRRARAHTDACLQALRETLDATEKRTS